MPIRKETYHDQALRFQIVTQLPAGKVVLAEKNLPHEIVPVDLTKKEQKNAEYLKMNPYGKVPVLTDDTTVLTSRDHQRILGGKISATPLLPKEPAKKAKARILIDYGMAHFDSPYQKLRMELTKEAKEQSQPTIDGAKAELKKLLQRFEEELGDQQYLLGDFSLVDANLIPRFTRLRRFRRPARPSLPRLRKYMERMKARPSVKAIL